MIRLTPVVVALFLTLFNGCDPLCDKCLPPPCFEPGDKSVFPLEVGNWWVYRVMDSSSGLPLMPPQKVVVVETESEPRVFRYSVEDDRRSWRWTRDTGDRIEWTRHVRMSPDGETADKDDRFDPPALRVDYSPARVCEGDHWTESYATLETVQGTETPSREEYLVEPAPAAVVHPAGGGNRNALCVRRLVQEGTAAKSTGTFCFVPGIGKVSEVTDKTEVLESYCTDGPSCCERTPAPGAPRTLCPDGCFDLAWDVDHCGRCDRACATGEVCRAGECVR